MRLTVRMAARTSRAFAFSPLAMAGDGGCGEDAGGLEDLASAGGGEVVAGCGDTLGGDSSAAAGFMGRESNSVGWRRDAFSRAT